MTNFNMSGKERWTAALWGKSVDRIPIWLFDGLKYEPTIDFTDDFLLSWRMNEKYRKMMKDFSDIIDIAERTGIYPFNCLLLMPEKYIERKDEIQKDANTKEQTAIIHAPHGDLYSVTQKIRGVNTIWNTGYPVRNIEDLRNLACVPFEVDYEAIDRQFQQFNKLYTEVGDKGIIQVILNSPIKVVSGCMPLDTFLELSVVEEDYFHELLEMIVDRYLKVFQAIFDRHDYDAVFWLCGSEQCTPPLMNPSAFDKFVVPYDKKLVDFLKSRGKLVGCHCHGKTKHALGCMIEAGYQATDPVQPPPQGDLSIDEAVEIVDGKMTLIGNLEFPEIEYRETAYMIQKTLDVLKHKDKRIVLGAAAAPISLSTGHYIDNYYAILNTYREFYGMKRIEPDSELHI